MCCHHILAIGHARTFSAIQDRFFEFAWAGIGDKMASAEIVGYN